MTKIHEKIYYSIEELVVMSDDEYRKAVKQMPRITSYFITAYRLYNRLGRAFNLEELHEYASKIYEPEWMWDNCVYFVKRKKELFNNENGILTPKDEIKNLKVRIVKPKEVKMDFIGTDKIRQKVSEMSTVQRKRELVERGLNANTQVLLYASAVQVMGKNYALVEKVPVEDRFDLLMKLSELKNSELNDQTILNMMSFEDLVAKYSINEPEVYKAPRDLVEKMLKCAEEMVNCLTQLNSENGKEYANELQKAKSILLNGDENYCILDKEARMYLANDFAGHGLINKMHQELIQLQKKVMEEQMIPLSKRVIVEKDLVENKKIKAFIAGWNKVKAELIIDRTTGKYDAGVIFTREGRGISGQIQVGDVNQHSIVLKDDGSIIQLQYNEQGSYSRAEFVRELFEQIELSSTIIGKTVKASGKSKPKIYYQLAKIIPNIIDLDLNNGYTHDEEYRKVACRAVLKGYAISTEEMREASARLASRKVSPKKMFRIIRKSSKLLGTDKYAEYLSKAKAKGGVKIGYKPYIPKPEVIPYKPGETVYIVGGKYGKIGQKVTVVEVKDGMVWVKTEDGQLWDKYPQNVSYKNPLEKEEKKEEAKISKYQVKLGEPIKLPWLGVDTFKELMKIGGVKYDKETKMFIFTAKEPIMFIKEKVGLDIEVIEDEAGKN